MTTKPTTDCKSKGWCHYDGPARTKFFHGMLLTDEHLRMEQSYHRKAIARLHRYMWGPGIVCGFEVEWVSALCIKVHAGLAIDCHGDAIESCTCITLDLSDECKKRFPGGCAPNDAPEFTKHLVIRYATADEDPQPVHGTSDDCGTTNGPSLQASRVREGFCFELVDDCPVPCKKEESKAAPQGQQQSQPAIQQAGAAQSQSVDPRLPNYLKPRPCPPCDCDCGCGAIGLATLTIDCKKSTVTVDDTCRHESQRQRDYREEAEFEASQQRRIAALEGQLIDLTNRLDKITGSYGSDLREELDRRVSDTAYSLDKEHLEKRLYKMTDDTTRLERKVDALIQRKPPGRGGSPPATPPVTPPGSPPPTDPNVT